MSEADNVAETIVAEALRWVGTPYRHQGSRKGVGCDCVGLLRGVWRGVYGRDLPAPGAYAPDWAEAGAEERLLSEARRFFAEKSLAEMEPGDVILFRWRPNLAVKHAGILTTQDRFAHAYSRSSVQVSALVPHWRRRLAAVFAFPMSDDLN